MKLQPCTCFNFFTIHKIIDICLTQVTLNMLNASETEMDAEEIGGDVKLEFESTAEEVTT